MMKSASISIIILTLTLLLPSCSGTNINDSGHADRHDHEAHAESDEIEINGDQMDAVGIKLGKMELRPMSSLVSATGQLQTAPQDEAFVTGLVSGRINSVDVREGQSVRKGDVIARVQTPDLLQTQKDYLEAEAEEKNARLELERQETLAAHGAGIRKNLENARTVLQIASISRKSLAESLARYGLDARDVKLEPLASVAVRAPISGTVTSLNIKNGEFVDPQTPLAVIVNTGNLFCTLRIFERDITNVKTGDEVNMHLTNNPEVKFSGRVSSSNPVLDDQTKSIAVRVALDSGQTQKLLPGMAVTASIISDESRVIALPEGGVVKSGGSHYIFILEDEHSAGSEKSLHFKKTEVAVGKSMDGYIEIKPLSPIAEGATVVTDGAFYLNSMASEHGEHSH